MSLPIEDQISGLDDNNVGILQKILDDIRRKAGTIRYTDTVPDTDSIEQDETVVYESGSTRRVYFRTANGNLTTLEERTANTALVIETRTSDPSSPTTGQIWLRTDL